MTDGVHRLGSRFVNWYLLETPDGLTVVDAGFPKHWPQLGELLERIGRRLEEIEAVILTHAHPDHLGTAERIRSETGARVFVHEADAAVAGGERKPRTPNVLPYLWRPMLLRYLRSAIGDGLLKVPPVEELTTFGDGERLDVPGRPEVVHLPGHTPGHCAFVPEGRDLVFGGDVCATVDVLVWAGGPRPLPGPYNDDDEAVMDSLSRLERIDASTLLVGHGDPWTDGVAEAARRAREAGIR